MNQSKEYIDDLIIQLLSGAIDRQGMKELESWIAYSDENKKYFHQQEELWFSAITSEALSKYNKEEAYRAFSRRIAAQVVRGEDSQKGTFHISRWLRYAASVLVLGLVSWFAYQQGQDRLSREFADITIEAPRGSRTCMTLPDGTVVWLNAGSHLTYSQGYGISNRVVSLKGEGFFEVRKNHQLPFSVSSNNLEINVHGTKFIFRDYPDDCDAEVVLLEGSISLNNLKHVGNTLSLNPGDKAVLDKCTGQISMNSCDMKTARQWTADLLVFNGEALPDIAKKLERSYNVKITIQTDSLKQCHFYGHFMRQEQSIRDVLNALGTTGKLRYKIDGHNITLY